MLMMVDIHICTNESSKKPKPIPVRTLSSVIVLYDNMLTTFHMRVNTDSNTIVEPSIL